MPYFTGTENTFADLLTTVRSNCVANGWTLSGNVLHKGDCYNEILEFGSNLGLTIQGGTGIDGSNNLTTTGSLAYMIAVLSAEPVTFPFTYFNFS